MVDDAYCERIKQLLKGDAEVPRVTKGSMCEEIIGMLDDARIEHFTPGFGPEIVFRLGNAFVEVNELIERHYDDGVADTSFLEAKTYFKNPKELSDLLVPKVATIETYTEDGITGKAWCSKCHGRVHRSSNYCQHCGAKFERD